MSIVRTTLIGIRNACRSARAAQAREIEAHLKALRDAAPEYFRQRGMHLAAARVDHVFDGVRDAVLGGQNDARIALADTRADDVAIEEAANAWADFAGYLNHHGLTCDRDWRWYDEGRRSGVVTLIVQL
ncbi:MAG TPA: hypothetical protein VL283_01720 [Candidatus Baltobacteraceae bacterium]|nr:hypothetical protein [Candidatus Baltobacteraceae bacterium]